MKKLIPFLFICLLLACDKDKFETKPQIEINSFNTEVLPPHADLVVNLKFTDKEGDLAGGQFVYIPTRLNKRRLPGQGYTPITVPVPEFSDNSKGEFALRLEWTHLHKSDLENDTINFRFAVTDRAGNTSDTVQSDRVVILRQ